MMSPPLFDVALMFPPFTSTFTNRTWAGLLMMKPPLPQPDSSSGSSIRTAKDGLIRRARRKRLFCIR